MKRIVTLVVVMMLGSVLLSACGEKPQAEAAKTEGTDSNEKAEGSGENSEAKADDTNALGNGPKVAIDIEDYGVITVALDEKAAPITVENFLKLTNEGFYDGLIFHRIIDGFMMQGGDPEGTGMGGADQTIKGEFSNNGVENTLKHTKGAISMARSMEPDSASSQFFIVDEDSSFLDGDYAVFGYVTDGIDIVDKICTEAAVIDGNGTVEDGKQPIIKTIKVLD